MIKVFKYDHDLESFLSTIKLILEERKELGGKNKSKSQSDSILELEIDMAAVKQEARNRIQGKKGAINVWKFAIKEEDSPMINNSELNSAKFKPSNIYDSKKNVKISNFSKKEHTNSSINQNKYEDLAEFRQKQKKNEYEKLLILKLILILSLIFVGILILF